MPSIQFDTKLPDIQNLNSMVKIEDLPSNMNVIISDEETNDIDSSKS